MPCLVNATSLVVYRQVGLNTSDCPRVLTGFGSLAGLRFNENQAGYIVGRDLPLLEQSSVAQYFLRLGHERGQVSLFIGAAERVFGPIPRDLRPKIEAASPDHLVKWMSNIRTASSWSDLISD